MVAVPLEVLLVVALLLARPPTAPWPVAATLVEALPIATFPPELAAAAPALTTFESWKVISSAMAAGAMAVVSTTAPPTTTRAIRLARLP
jgi:hypothetical protein